MKISSHTIGTRSVTSQRGRLGTCPDDGLPRYEELNPAER